MNLIEKILTAIEEQNIQNFTLKECKTETEELFFVKKELTLSRNKNVSKCDVTIYHDFEKDGTKMRGSSSFVADLTMSIGELTKKIAAAYTSAHSVCNPYYKLPASNEMFVEQDTIHTVSADTAFDMNYSSNSNADNQNVDTDSANDSGKQLYSANDIADILYKNDNNPNAFINSLEIFVTAKKVTIINSNGVNISYNEQTYDGEFIVQCKEPNDVELYQNFQFSSLDKNIDTSLADLLSQNLQMVHDRANAISLHDAPDMALSYKSVILEGSSVYELFLYYLKRLDASMIYPGYSQFKIGEPVISNSNADKLTITLTPKQPYSSEGVKLIHTNLIKDNIANRITGNARFSFYLGIPAIGEYESFQMDCGSNTLSELCKEPYLKIVNFSDFQMNELTGQFGGEFRLAYYFDGTKTIPVTGGSITGNINDIVKTIRFSKESQSFYNFNGPKAVSYKA